MLQVSTDGNAVSIVQAHESFRRCVGQSTAEFALDLFQMSIRCAQNLNYDKNKNTQSMVGFKLNQSHKTE